MRDRVIQHQAEEDARSVDLFVPLNECLAPKELAAVHIDNISFKREYSVAVARGSNEGTRPFVDGHFSRLFQASFENETAIEMERDRFVTALKDGCATIGMNGGPCALCFTTRNTPATRLRITDWIDQVTGK